VNFVANVTQTPPASRRVATVARRVREFRERREEFSDEIAIQIQLIIRVFRDNLIDI